MRLLKTVLMQSVLLLCFFMYDLNASYVTPPEPEAPRTGDPDISSLTDQRLVHIWNDTVVAYRRLNPAGIFDLDSQYISTLKPVDTQEYLIALLDTELHKKTIDWNSIQSIVMVMSVGMDTDTRIPELARFMLELPRSGKMSNTRTISYGRILRVLGNQKSMDAVKLLCEVVDRKFWGNDPMYIQPTKRDSEKGIYRYRNSAVSALAERIPPKLSIPALKQLAETYPSLPESEQGYDAEIGRRIQILLTGLLKKQGQNHEKQ